MVAVTFAGIVGWSVAVLVTAAVAYLAGVYSLAWLRIWWARQTGRGSCQFCGRPLTIQVAWLFEIPWTLRVPAGFFHVCAWCGRDQPEVA